MYKITLGKAGIKCRHFKVLFEPFKLANFSYFQLSWAFDLTTIVSLITTLL